MAKQAIKAITISNLIDAVTKKTRYEIALSTIGYDVKLPDDDLTIADMIAGYNKTIEQIKVALLFDESE